MPIKRILLVFLIIASLTLTLAGSALTAGSPPVGGCLPGWELHPFMDHVGHMDHVGLAQDLNGDGYICVLHTSAGMHVHMDNVVPLQ